MSAPTFFILGVQKAGTTWLSEMIRQHPDISLPPVKELHFFDHALDHASSLEDYLSEFAGRETAAVGEATPDYLWIKDALPPEAAERCDLRYFGRAAHPDLNPNPVASIQRSFPDARLIVVLRDPVTRAVSAFRHHIRMRRLSPRERITRLGGPQRGLIGDRFGVVAEGFYHAQLMELFKSFDVSQLLVLIMEEDIMRDPNGTLRRVFGHLGVDPNFVASGVDHASNAGSSDPFLVANRWSPALARRAFGALPRLHRLPWPRISVTEQDQAELADLYGPEVARLGALLGRDLSLWGTMPTPVRR